MKRKRIVAALLSLAMTVGSLQMTVFADESSEEEFEEESYAVEFESRTDIPDGYVPVYGVDDFGSRDYNN